MFVKCRDHSRNVDDVDDDRLTNHNLIINHQYGYDEYNGY